MPVLRVLIIVMLCHFFAYGMYSSQLPVFLSDTFIWNGLPFGPKALSYLLMADGVINIFVQLFLLGWVSQYFFGAKANYPHLRPSLYWISHCGYRHDHTCACFCYRLY